MNNDIGYRIIVTRSIITEFTLNFESKLRIQKTKLLLRLRF